jgi:hypothetical protein
MRFESKRPTITSGCPEGGGQEARGQEGQRGKEAGRDLVTGGGSRGWNLCDV